MDELVNCVLKSCATWHNTSCRNGTRVEEFIKINIREDFQIDDVYVLENGRLISKNSLVRDGATYHIVPRMPGGKGGFGSMLRAIGAQIEKTTNREACRDLSGRRMRDINNEQKLREWVAKQAEREKEKEERRKARLERRKAVPQHKFENRDYEQQKSKALDNLDDAIHSSLVGEGPSTSTASRKRKAVATVTSSSKRSAEWLGLDSDDSDLNSEDSEDNDTKSMEITGSPHPPSVPLVTPELDTMNQQGAECTQAESSLANSSEEASKSIFNKAIDVETIASLQGSLKTESELQPEQKDNSGTKFQQSDKNTTNDDTSDNVQTIVRAQTEQVTTENSKKENCQTKDQEQSKVVLEKKEPLAEVKHENVAAKILTIEEVDAIESLENMESLGLDSLKATLMSLGLKCGGSLPQRAERLWAVRGLDRNDWPRSLLAKRKIK